MLKTLKPYSKKDAQQLLARVTDFYLPNPGLDNSSSVPDEASSQVVAELRSRIGLDNSDRSPEATSRILSELADEMSEYALNGVNLNSVKARLGQRGDLPLELYHIQFAKMFANSEKLTITKEEVLEALHSPDAIEHLLPERFSPQGLAFSLFLRRKTDHFLLVQASRNASTLSVDLTWRIYNDSINARGSGTPLDALKAFVDAFGIFVQAGEAIPTKFVLYDAFPAPHPLPPNYDPLKIIDEGRQTFGSFSIVRASSLNVIEVAIAYAINLDEYIRTLQGHGWKQLVSKTASQSVILWEPM